MKTKPALSADAKRVAALLRKSLLRQSKERPGDEALFLPSGFVEDASGFRLKFPTEKPPPPVATTTDPLSTNQTLRTHQICEGMKALTHARPLCEVIRAAAEQLLALAKSGNREAVKSLAMTGACAATELEKLARTKLDLVRSVAREFPWWPVPLSPHAENHKEILALIDNLQVATATPERMRGRWHNAPAKEQPYRHLVSKYAVWLGQTLRRVHANRVLREAVLRDPAAWPEWVAEAVNLKPLTKTTAPAWFKVGWKMLLALTEGDVTKIQELRPVGESNAGHWKSKGFSATVQASQRATGIRKALRLAFLERFGN